MHKPVLTSLTMEKTIEVIVDLFRDQAPAQVLLSLNSYIACYLAMFLHSRPQRALLLKTFSVGRSERLFLYRSWICWGGAWLPAM